MSHDAPSVWLAVGAKAAWHERASFSRAPLVFQREEGGDPRLRVGTRIDEAGQPAGESLSVVDWRALREAGEAIEAPRAGEGQPAPQPSAWLWIVREAFPRRRELEAKLEADKRVVGRWPGPNGEVGLLVHDAGSYPLRCALAESAHNQGLSRLRDGALDEALRFASASFCLNPCSAENIALMAHLFDRNGRHARCDGMLRMAEGSYGAAFGRLTKEALERLQREGPGTEVRNRRHRTHFSVRAKDALGKECMVPPRAA